MVKFKSPACRQQPGAGFSLLEVALAITLLTAVCLAAALLLVPIARQSRINRETEIANAEAQRVLERVQATPFRDLLEVYPQGTTVTIPQLNSGSLNVNYADPTADPLMIQISMSWSSLELGDMQLTFDTVRTE